MPNSAGEIAQTSIQMPHRIALLILSLVLVACVLELVRRGRLKERYALLWLTASAAGLIVGIFPGLIDALARLLHLQYITVLFVGSFLFLLALVLCFSVVISRLAERNRDLAQEVALLGHKVEGLEKGDGK